VYFIFFQIIIIFRFPASRETLSLGGLDGCDELGRWLLAVALRVVADPAPEILACLLHGELGLPVELRVGQGRVSSEIQDVTVTAGVDDIGEITADSGAEGLDHLEDGGATARAQVPGLNTGFLLTKVVEGDKVALGEIQDVDVVSDSGAVAGCVVYGLPLVNVKIVTGGGLGFLTVAKNEELLTLACSDLAEKRQQVVRNALGVLSHDTAGVSTARVEVAEESTVPLLERLAGLLQVVALSVDLVGDDILNDVLGATVDVGRTAGAVLGDGNHVLEAGGIAVDGGGGGEDDVGDIVAGHGAEEGDAAADVDTVVLEGNFARFANSLVAIVLALPSIRGRQPWITLRAAKWITLSISGCLEKTSSRPFSSVMSTL
jgi:hypothetical protein